jgi:penicillin-binding protein 1A
MTDLLQAVVKEANEGAKAHFTCAHCGQTGTSNDYTDAWFVGFSPGDNDGMGRKGRPQAIGKKKAA